ncbi:MAG TPA: hypothetical protein VFJ09_10515 [Nocardioidaceae bacterium]|nr:hypothetical protein [Nocardioidaceae bacterium]
MSVPSEIDARTPLGEVYMQSLVRSQLRLAVGVVLLLAGTFGVLPLLFWVFPALSRLHVLGIPLPWFLLGFVAYPFLMLVGRFYVRRAERNERAFTDLVDPQ